MTGHQQTPGHSGWIALDTALMSLRQCRTAQQLTEQAAILAVQACAAVGVLLGHVVGSQWLPWLHAGDLELVERLGAIPLSPTSISALPRVDQRAVRTGEAGTRHLPAVHPSEIVASAVVTAGTARGLIYVVGSDLNQEIVQCYAHALGAVLDLIRSRQCAEQQQYILARIRGDLAEPIYQPIELVGEAAPSSTSRPTPTRSPSSTAAPRERLTNRQREVLELMMAGLTNAEIAERLVVALPTVKSHVRVLLRLSGSVNRAEALARYSERPYLSRLVGAAVDTSP